MALFDDIPTDFKVKVEVQPQSIVLIGGMILFILGLNRRFIK